MGQEIDWGSFTATSLSNIEIPEMSPGTPDLSQVSLRTNLQETAFFFPELTSDDEGVGCDLHGLACTRQVQCEAATVMADLVDGCV